jgi:hypothetical protein
MAKRDPLVYPAVTRKFSRPRGSATASGQAEREKKEEESHAKQKRREKSEAMNQRHDEMNARLFGHLMLTHNNDWASDLEMETKWPHHNFQARIKHHFPEKTVNFTGKTGQLDSFGIRNTPSGKVMYAIEVKTNGNNIDLAPKEDRADHGVTVQLRRFVDYCNGLPVVPILGYAHGITEFLDLPSMVSREKRNWYSEQVGDVLFDRLNKLYDWEFLHWNGVQKSLSVGDAVDLFRDKIPGYEFEGDLDVEDALYCSDIVGIRMVRGRSLIVSLNVRGNKGRGSRGRSLFQDLQCMLHGLKKFASLTQAPFYQQLVGSPWAVTEFIDLNRRLEEKSVELYNFWLPRPIKPNLMSFNDYDD